MKLAVVWSPAAIQSMDNIVSYLDEHWSQKEADAFVNQVFNIIDKLRDHPQMYEESRNRKNQHKAFITEQVSLIYLNKPRKQELYLLRFWDNRQHPAKLKH